MANKDEMLGNYIEKGMLTSIAMLQEDDYLTVRNDVKTVFA